MPYEALLQVKKQKYMHLYITTTKITHTTVQGTRGYDRT
jgi:hypothetical protein